MADHIPRPVPPHGIMGLRKSLLVGGGLAVLLVALGLAWMVHRLTASKPKSPTLPPAPLYNTVGGGRKAILADEPRTYDAIPKPKAPPTLPPRGIPLGTVEAAVPSRVDLPRPDQRLAAVQPIPVPPGPSPAEVEARIRAGIAEAKAQMLQEQNRALTMELAQQRSMQAVPLVQGQAPPGQVVQGQGQGQGQGGQEKDPKKRAWDTMVKDMKQQEGQSKSQDEQRQGGDDLIHRAHWSEPRFPLRTLYKSMELAGRLLTSIQSDIPGMVKIILTVPTVDKFGYHEVILPKGTIIIAYQETQQVKFGATRIALKIDQIELPSGEIIKVDAKLADGEGAQGLTGEVNNHYGKLIVATGINALLSLGANSLAGTPEGFYPNAAQQAARDAAQSTSSDIRRITSEQLKVPPSIYIPSGTICSVQLSENITFSRKPRIVD